MRLAACLIVALAVSPARAVAAQDTTDLRPGTRVRVTTSDEIYEGSLLPRQDDSFRLQVPGESAPIAVPRSAITEIAVSAGRHSNAAAGATVGFLAGAAGGVILFQAYNHCDGFFCGPYTGGTVALGAMLSGATGALVGALIGSSITSERWVQLPLNRIHVTLGHGGPGVALSFTF
jgi:hypothetical protein